MAYCSEKRRVELCVREPLALGLNYEYVACREF